MSSDEVVKPDTKSNTSVPVPVKRNALHKMKTASRGVHVNVHVEA